MKIISLDQATATGYAVGDNHSFENRTVESGIFKMPKRDVLGERLVIFRTTLNELIDHYKPELIAYEKPFWPAPGAPRGSVMIDRVVAMVSKMTADQVIRVLKAEEKKEGGPPRIDAATLQFLQKVEGMVECTATERGLPYEAYSPASWRVTAVGYGRAPRDGEDDHMKKAMLAKAKQLGYAPQSYDEADAIGILMHALHGKPANERAQGDLLAMAKDMI